MTQRNMMLLYEDSGAVVALSGGSYVGTLPIGNLLTDDLSAVARTVDADPASTVVNVTLDDTYYARAILVGPGNFTPLMRYRIRSYTDAFATIKYDTGWLYSVGGQYEAPIRWGEPNFWLRGKTGRNSLVHIFPAPQIARYWSIEIDDQTNPAGYLDMGRLMMPMGWQPSLNYSEGGGVAFSPNAMRQQTLSGGEIVRDRPRYRTFNCQFSYLSEAEATLETQRLVEACGASKPIFAIPNPDDTANMGRNAFFARLLDGGNVEHLVPFYARTGFTLKEII